MWQQIINYIYRYPRKKLSEIHRFGGWNEWIGMNNGQRAMMAASKNLVVKPPAIAHATYPVYFLTGKKYWYQTVFCAYSLQKQCEHVSFHFYIIDDGTFDDELVQLCNMQLTNSTFASSHEIEYRIQSALPMAKYPFLNHKRLVYKHIRKLTDVHAGLSGYKLLLDSDMLFWGTPHLMLHWLSAPANPFFIIDSDTAYGYPLEYMNELCQEIVYPRLNVGAIGLSSSNIDFDKLEYWGKMLEQKHGTSYYLEQALTAMLVGSKPCTIGSTEQYIVYPSAEEVHNPMAVLHHYVDVSKKYYYTHAWRLAGIT
ncbi:MAG: hypothetical protein NW207_11610 [Cytophagales bacterium]|nr:hypothetical protein [Cytophagales bacterium]